MARMIPNNLTFRDFNDSVGEERVYSALSTLPDKYIVFHSVRWNKKHINGKVQWGESDFVLYDPDRGILVIEVKSGGISCSDGRWYQTNLKTGEEHQMRKSPMLQADYGKYTFLDLLSESDDVNVNSCRVEPIVWFPSISDKRVIGNMPNEYREENVLTQNDFNNIQSSIDRAFDFYNIKKKEYSVSDSEIKKIIDILSPNFDIFPNLATEADDQDFSFNRLTREQSYLLDYLEEQHSAAIQGGGGTGKTMLAIEKARRLSKNSSVLFLCFNKMLLEYLRNRYDDELDNVHFYNLQSLYHKLTRKANDADDDAISDFLNEYDKYEWNFKHIIIDEGQDFADEHLDILNTIAKLAGGDFYVFYDKNQLVQRFDMPNWIDKMECRLILSRNCRNTINIATTSFASIGVDKVKMGIDIIGQKPTLSIVKDKQNTMDNIAETIRYYKEQGFQKKQITILTLKTEKKSVLYSETSVGGYRITDNIADKEILFTTARKFKGLESDVVIIVDFDETIFQNEENRKMFYVASSRAKHILHIVGTMADDKVNELASNIFGEEKKNPKLAISSYLKVKVIDSLI